MNSNKLKETDIKNRTYYFLRWYDQYKNKIKIDENHTKDILLSITLII